MESLWKKDFNLEERCPLVVDTKCDVCIIGAGMVGILSAYALQKEGINVVVLEASEIASGQTGNTTAKITSQHGLIYKKLIDEVGFDRAYQYAQANQEAIESYQNIINENKIECDFERIPAYLYTTKSPELLKREEEAALKLGISCKYIETSPTVLNEKALLRFENQAQFHPLKFIEGLIDDMRIYTNSRVIQVEGNQVITKYAKVEASHIVFACHYPFINAPGYYFTKLYQERSYVIAFENALPLHGAYIGIEDEGLSLRWHRNILLIGRENHRTGENSVGGCYDKILTQAKAIFPQAKEVGRWSAQDCMSLDQIPYIGKYSTMDDGWYVATGFNKWGMTSSMVASKILTDMIMQRENKYSQVFNSIRSCWANIPEVVDNASQAIKGLSLQFLTMPEWHAQDLQRGHGGVVELGKEKVGVYKDEQGEIHAVSVKCPHLGCQLEWNPDELSWDCPCHGSRFDYKGNLLDNPAQEDIKI